MEGIRPTPIIIVMWNFSLCFDNISFIYRMLIDKIMAAPLLCYRWLKMFLGFWTDVLQEKKKIKKKELLSRFTPVYRAVIGFQWTISHFQKDHSHRAFLTFSNVSPTPSSEKLATSTPQLLCHVSLTAWRDRSFGSSVHKSSSPNLS